MNHRKGNYTRVQISHLVVCTACCPKLSTSLEQAVLKQLVTTLLILLDLFKGCSNKSDTVSMQQYCYNLLSSTL